MKLQFAQIKECTQGAVRIEQEDGGIAFYRFTKEQETLLKQRKEEFYNHSLGTAGVCLVFKTESQSLGLKVNVEPPTSRKRFSFDIFSDGKLIANLDNFSNVDLPEGEKRIDLPVGRFQKEISLGEGEKLVKVHFPYSVKAMLEEVTLDDNASFTPVKSTKKMLAYGDSITQGYYALRPSERYTARLAEYLGAEEINRGVGSDRFCPDLVKMYDDVSVDYIVVAHGTNDWRTNRTREMFCEMAKTCYGILRKHHPQAKIIGVSPIWRADYQDERPYGNFTNIENDIRDILKDDSNTVVVSGFNLVPHDKKYYGDFIVHPNDLGFQKYFENLKKMI